MFYNHEILTSRKYGIATIWLVATLGSKSSLRKINRKAIYEVDIAKACETITEPAVPMALRLQSSLLFGVTRVYDQQCTFVLTELQSLQNSMKHATHKIAGKGLDLEVGRAVRPEQLLLQDDPNFLPDFAFDNLALDANLVAVPDLSHDHSSQSSAMSPHTPSRSDLAVGLAQLIVPSSVSAGQAGFGLGFLPSGGSRLSSPGRSSLGRLEGEGNLLDIDYGFTFAPDGEMVTYEPSSTMHPGSTAGRLEASTTGVRPRAESDTSALAHVRREQDAIPRADADAFDNMDLNLDLGNTVDDYAVPLDTDAEPFPPRHPANGTTAAASQPNILASSTADGTPQHEETPEATETAEAAQRRTARVRRAIKEDSSTQLSAREIAAWNTDYLANMAEQAASKAAHRAPHIAKKNAEFWVWTMGIGGVGVDLSRSGIPSPLDIFYGEGLFGLVTGTAPVAVAAGQKRSRASGSEESGSEGGRRVRPRDDGEAEIGRGDADVAMEDPPLEMPMDMDEDASSREPEIGRDAPTPLNDPSLALPWNLSASQRSRSSVLPGSAIPFGRGTHHLSRAPSISSATPLPALRYLGGRRSVAPSPLVGHGLPAFGAGAATSSVLGAGDYADTIAVDDAGIADVGDTQPVANEETMQRNEDPDYERFGPAAAVDTQKAEGSQWVQNELHIESRNFLLFVDETIQKAAPVLNTTTNEEDAVTAKELTFETLLFPARNSIVVAAQGFLHCLALATQGLLTCRQEEAFEDIWIGVTGRGVDEIVTIAAREGERLKREEEERRQRDENERYADARGVATRVVEVMEG